MRIVSIACMLLCALAVAGQASAQQSEDTTAVVCGAKDDERQTFSVGSNGAVFHSNFVVWS